MPQPPSKTDIVTVGLDQIIAEARQIAADGRLTVAEFGRITVALIKLGVTLAQPLAVPGADKKAVVMAAVATLFDAVADKCVPMMAYPAWLVIRPAVRSLVLAAAGGALEAILVMLFPKG